MGSRPLPFSWVDAWKRASPSPDAPDERHDPDGLPRGVRLCLYALAQYMDARGVAWPSQRALAGDTGYTSSYVRRCLEEAESRGWLIIVRGGGPPGLGGSPHLYRAATPESVDALVHTPPESVDAPVHTSGNGAGSVDVAGESVDTGVMRAWTPASTEHPRNNQKNVVSRSALARSGESSEEAGPTNPGSVEVPDDFEPSPDDLATGARLATRDPDLRAWTAARLAAQGVQTTSPTTRDIEFLPAGDRRALAWRAVSANGDGPDGEAEP